VAECADEHAKSEIDGTVGEIYLAPVAVMDRTSRHSGQPGPGCKKTRPHLW